MAHCEVFGFKPGTGPGPLAAHAALHDINRQNPDWQVTLKHELNAKFARYTSTVAPAHLLCAALKQQFTYFIVCVV